MANDERIRVYLSKIYPVPGEKNNISRCSKDQRWHFRDSDDSCLQFFYRPPPVPTIRPIFRAMYGNIHPISMANKMVLTYLHFRILEFPLILSNLRNLVLATSTPRSTKKCHEIAIQSMACIILK